MSSDESSQSSVLSSSGSIISSPSSPSPPSPSSSSAAPKEEEDEDDCSQDNEGNVSNKRKLSSEDDSSDSAKNASKRLLPISLKLNPAKPETTTVPKPLVPIATAFQDDSDSEPEEMPPAAKMRMRNIGRDTPVSSRTGAMGRGSAPRLFEDD